MPYENDSEKDQAHPKHALNRRKFLSRVAVAGAGAALADHLSGLESVAASPIIDDFEKPIKGRITIALDVNDQKRPLTVEPRTTLLNALRNHLEPAVTGPKLVCDVGTCGACTVLMDGKPVYSCLILAVDATTKKLTSVEGLGIPERLNSVQQAFIDHDALMCGFCTPGFVTTISAYLKKNAKPTMDEIREACKGNFCRCGTYPRVFEAALAVARLPAVR
ncbi:MAG TPA: (2Fe-2S)-binding protein [Pyrinomonadaceae bacterium]|nr:(2Fe-2S)-binding protein [Pyrinomonadaceae bacterium]